MNGPVQLDLPRMVGNFSLYKVCLVVGVLQHVMLVCNCSTYSILNRALDTRTFCIFIICKCCHRNKGHIDNTYIRLQNNSNPHTRLCQCEQNPKRLKPHLCEHYLDLAILGPRAKKRRKLHVCLWERLG